MAPNLDDGGLWKCSYCGGEVRAHEMALVFELGVGSSLEGTYGVCGDCVSEAVVNESHEGVSVVRI